MRAGPEAASGAVRTVLPTRHGTFRMHGYDGGNGLGHVALLLGDVTQDGVDDLAPLVRVHSECLTGDALGSYRCDCGEQLDAALAEIGREGRGVLIYLRGHEGRGIGLLPKLRAYALQDAGVDTVDANRQLGYPADAREYTAAAAILRELGVTRVRLMSSNPDKVARLTELGIEVTGRHPLAVAERAENAYYLATKRVRMGHEPLTAPDAWAELLTGRVPERSATASDAALLERYGWLARAGDRVAIAQLGQSADGFIAARTGDAEFVTGAHDREHLHRMRALVDAVVVGASTVVADDPQLTVRAVTGPSPVRVLLDPCARIPTHLRVMDDGVSPTLWCVAAEAVVPDVKPHVEVLRLPVGPDGFEPRDVLTALAGRGLGRVLVEGGGRTVSRFLAGGSLDRLYLTTAPLLIGDGVPGIRFTGSDRLADALRAPVRRFVLGDDVCTEFDLSTRPHRPSGSPPPLRGASDDPRHAVHGLPREHVHRPVLAAEQEAAQDPDGLRAGLGQVRVDGRLPG